MFDFNILIFAMNINKTSSITSDSMSLIDLNVMNNLNIDKSNSLLSTSTKENNTIKNLFYSRLQKKKSSNSCLSKSIDLSNDNSNVNFKKKKVSKSNLHSLIFSFDTLIDSKKKTIHNEIVFSSKLNNQLISTKEKKKKKLKIKKSRINNNTFNNVISMNLVSGFKLNLKNFKLLFHLNNLNKFELKKNFSLQKIKNEFVLPESLYIKKKNQIECLEFQLIMSNLKKNKETKNYYEILNKFKDLEKKNTLIENSIDNFNYKLLTFISFFELQINFYHKNNNLLQNHKFILSNEKKKKIFTEIIKLNVQMDKLQKKIESKFKLSKQEIFPGYYLLLFTYKRLSQNRDLLKNSLKL